MYTPFDIQLVFKDGSRGFIHETPAFWKDGKDKGVVGIEVKKDLHAAWVDGGIFMDSNEADNLWIGK